LLTEIVRMHMYIPDFQSMNNLFSVCHHRVQPWNAKNVILLTFIKLILLDGLKTNLHHKPYDYRTHNVVRFLNWSFFAWSTRTFR